MFPSLTGFVQAARLASTAAWGKYAEMDVGAGRATFLGLCCLVELSAFGLPVIVTCDPYQRSLSDIQLGPATLNNCRL